MRPIVRVGPVTGAWRMATVSALLVAAAVVGGAPCRGQFQQPFRVFTAVGIVNTPENNRALAEFNWHTPTVLDREGFVYMGGWVGEWFGPRSRTGDYESKWPVVGPHNLDDAAEGRHQARVREDVRARVPPGFSGVVCIDYEGAFCWSQATAEQKAAWERSRRLAAPETVEGLDAGAREAFLRDSFNQRVREIVSGTLRAARQERPAARFGFYAQPPQMYWEWFSPEKAEAVRRVNSTELAWLWSTVDAVFPSVYQFYRVVPEPVNDRGHGEQTLAAFQRYVTASVLEAQRVAAPRRLPVYAWVWWRYHDNGARPLEDYPHGLDFVGDVEMAEMFTLPRALGCQGVIIYDYMSTPAHVRRMQDVYDRRVMPILRDLAR